jgi:hypothetical protein
MSDENGAEPYVGASAGARLWNRVLADYELSEPELVLLREACRTADAVEELHGYVDEQGTMIDGRPNPALVELRQQRILLARLVVALRVPLDDDGDVVPGGQRTQARPIRGPYQPRGLLAVDEGRA